MLPLVGSIRVPPGFRTPADAVLHGPAGVEVLDFRDDFRGALVQLADADERRISYQFGNAFVDVGHDMDSFLFDCLLFEMFLRCSFTTFFVVNADKIAEEFPAVKHQ